MIIYSYGYYIKDYYFHPNIDVTNNYHFTIHLFYSLCWTIIIL
jgi:hypothetical protein